VAAPTFMGALVIGMAQDFTKFYDGGLDEFRFWNRALSAGDAAVQYNGRSNHLWDANHVTPQSKPSDPTMVCWLNFDYTNTWDYSAYSDEAPNHAEHVKRFEHKHDAPAASYLASDSTGFARPGLSFQDTVNAPLGVTYEQDNDLSGSVGESNTLMLDTGNSAPMMTLAPSDSLRLNERTFSISFWGLFKQTGIVQTILHQEGAGGTGVHIGFDATELPTFTVADSTLDCPADSATPTCTLPGSANRLVARTFETYYHQMWTHYTFQWDRATKEQEIFIFGKRVTSKIGATAPTSDASIGIGPAVMAIDEMQFWDVRQQAGWGNIMRLGGYHTSTALRTRRGVRHCRAKSGLEFFEKIERSQM